MSSQADAYWGDFGQESAAELESDRDAELEERATKTDGTRAALGATSAAKVGRAAPAAAVKLVHR
ncbi:hypothetical protein [Lichenifustis flavocetrariae]|uniref:Uncharacterized protein n=1 Tax=Lichenifustis flavocetrariae TaxID=2949735 RepID=A0AA41Z4X1_9HYPH|nr:hypothetical protein [Lichenifustis flavocetrariae]MCW6513132.1 hypothetical protein [Lichenifustis flavocetrariae]